jgi:hypothetical protein
LGSPRERNVLGQDREAGLVIDRREWLIERWPTSRRRRIATVVAIVAIVVATAAGNADSSTLGEVERSLQRQLRSYDLLLRVREGNWLLCAAFRIHGRTVGSGQDSHQLLCAAVQIAPVEPAIASMVYLHAIGRRSTHGFRFRIAHWPTRSLIRQDPLNGHLFVFLNRRRTRIKLLVWDRTGYVLLYKRLERGTFHVATQPAAGQRHVEVDAGELALMLEGVDLRGAVRRERWRRLPHGPAAPALAAPPR